MQADHSAPSDQEQEASQSDSSMARALSFLGRGARFALLPGFVPRLRGLAAAAAHFLFMFTQIFGLIGAIDRFHPCLNPANAGRYRFHDIVRLAFGNVWRDRKNVPKLIMFFVVVATYFMTLALFMVTIAMFVLRMSKAYAQFYGDSVSEDYSPANDWAYSYLGEVFGNTGIAFWGPHGVGPDKNILFNEMLRHMFATYSQALLILAVLIIIYLIVHMIIESARTGVPFGKSFNSFWGPIRLAFGIAMLVPVSQGYSGAQLMAFQASAWGSALATNIWIAGLSTFNDPKERIIYAAQPREPYTFIRDLFLTYTCRDAMNINIQDFCMGNFVMGDDVQLDGVYNFYTVGTYRNVKNGDQEDRKALVNDYCGSYKIPEPDKFEPVEIGFGEENMTSPDGTNQNGQQAPLMLGALSQLIVLQYEAFYNEALPIITAATGKIATEIHDNEQKRIQEMTDADIQSLHARLLKLYKVKMGYKDGLYFNSSQDDPPLYPASDPDHIALESAGLGSLSQHPPGFKEAAEDDGQVLLGVLNQSKKYGWASAGSVMMTLSSVNDIVSSAVNAPPFSVSQPRLLHMPAASPYYRNAAIEDRSDDGDSTKQFYGFRPYDLKIIQRTQKTLATANTWFVDRPADRASYDSNGSNTIDTIAQETGIRTNVWANALKAQDNTGNVGSGEIIPSAFQSVMLSWVQMDELDINPMAHMIAIGTMLENAALLLTGFAILIGQFKAFSTIIFTLVVAAYFLNVILPMALFAHFMFAVIEWVISVFEAVVGMPLAALSMISIKGQFMGKYAISSVLNLFELMLRPSVIVMVTVGALIIFSTCAQFFNKAFMLYQKAYFDSTDGVIKDLLAIVGSIFMYVVTMYSIGNACFRLIPEISNSFARWFDGPEGFSAGFQTDIDKISGVDNIQSTLSMGASTSSLTSSLFKGFS